MDQPAVIRTKSFGKNQDTYWSIVLDWLEDATDVPFADPPITPAFAGVIQAAFIADIIPIMTSAADIVGTTAYFLGATTLNPADPPIPEFLVPVLAEFTDLTGAGTVGGVVSDPLPSFASATVRKLTPLPGRVAKGQVHFPGMLESYTTGQKFSGANLAAMQAAFDAFLGSPYAITDGVNTWHFRLGVLSMAYFARNLHSASRWPQEFTFGVTSTPLNAIVGTERRRKLRA